MNRGEELYKLYKNRKARVPGASGIVVGHDDISLIVAVTEGKPGWHELPEDKDYGVSDSDDMIYDLKDNSKGYLYVGKEDIVN